MQHIVFARASSPGVHVLPYTVDVSEVLPPGAMGTLSATLYLPADSEQEILALLYCIPGGSYRGVGYFDRVVPGEPETYSIARALAARGIALCVVDVLGTGASTTSLPGKDITVEVTSRVNAFAIGAVRHALLAGLPDAGISRAGRLPIAVFGHSMGAFQATHLAAHLQQRGETISTAIFAGWTNGPQLDEGRMRVSFAEQARAMALSPDGGYYLPVNRAILRPFFYEDVPSSLIEADEVESTSYPLGLMSGLLPGIVRTEAARLTCPVLHVLAERADVSSAPERETGYYERSPFKALYIQHGAGHCNFEESRQEYWTTVAGWVKMTAEPHDLASRGQAT